MSHAGSGQITTANSIQIPIPLPNGFWANLSYSEYKWRLNETYEERSYGYIHQGNYFTSGSSAKKFERIEQGNTLFAGQDFYSVSAQGINGTFMPFVKEPFLLFDGSGSNETGQLKYEETTLGFGPYTNQNEVVFRFLDDIGANFCTEDEAGGAADWGDDYDNAYADRFQSQIINPVINIYSGKIDGFTIVDTDGKVYEFLQPVKNSFQYSYTFDDANNFESYTWMASPYAGNWLLTAIKGPDYVDRDSNDECSDGDWGYWVKLHYEKEASPQIWRSPYSGTGPHESSPDIEVASLGVRDRIHLSKIETSTHLAIFDRSVAKDRYVADIDKLIYVTGDVHTFDPPDCSVSILGNWTDALDAISPTSNVNLLTVSAIKNGVYTQNNDYTISDMSWQYITGDDVTRITVDFDVTEPDDWEFSWSHFFVSNLYGSSYTSATKLDKVELFSKADPDVNFTGGTWVINPGATSLKSACLTYDYSLCPNTPNSEATTSDGANQGKLTLQRVEFLGKNGTSGLPPYVFEYANNDAPGSGLNPDYHEYDWDSWGSYRDPGTDGSDRGKYKHITPQDPIRANQAAAWSLTRITTPTGGSIEISYESDDYYEVNGFIDLDKIDYATTNAITGNGSNSFTSTSQTFINKGPKVGDLIAILHDEEICPNCDDLGCQQNQDGTIREITNVSQNGGTITVDFDGPGYNFQTNSQNPPCIEHEYWVTLYNRSQYGGGIRVKSIASSDGIHKYKTVYNYSVNGYSTGVTASLPALYQSKPSEGINFLNGEGNSFFSAYLDYEGSYGRPSPGVLYSLVEVQNVDKDGMPVNGKTVYEFYTSTDYPYSAPDLSGFEIEIVNRSGIYGKPKAITYYEQYDNSGQIEFRPIQKEEFEYDFSTGLYNNGKIETEDGQDLLLGDKPLGMIQEKYGFSKNWSNKRIDKQYENVYAVSSNSTEFSYSSQTSSVPTGELLRKSRNIKWNALTGEVLAGASQKSGGGTYVSRKTPAYWKYPGMSAKNMLTQVTHEAQYVADIDVDDVMGLRSYGFDIVDIVSSSVTTWSNEWLVDGVSDPIWRKNDTYVYNKDIDDQDGIWHFVNPQLGFDLWGDGTNNNGVELPYPAVSSASPWKMISNVTKYNPNSQPVESVGEDGRYTSALYDETNSRVIATALNAGVDESLYLNFETESGSDAFTGVAGKAINGADIFLHNTPGETPSIGGQYRVELWVKPNSGTITLEGQTGNSAQTQAGNFDWQVLAIEGVPANQPIHVSGNGNVDDLRIYPELGQMSTFAYDPLTNRVTSMSDANNITAFFEFDDFGRLVLARDQDQNIVRRHTYRLNRGADFYYSPFTIEQNDNVLFYAQAAKHPQNGAITKYRFVLKNAQGTVLLDNSIYTPDDPITFFSFSSDGTYTMTLILYEASDEVDVVEKTFVVNPSS